VPSPDSPSGRVDPPGVAPAKEGFRAWLSTPTRPSGAQIDVKLFRFPQVAVLRFHTHPCEGSVGDPTLRGPQKSTPANRIYTNRPNKPRRPLESLLISLLLGHIEVVQFVQPRRRRLAFDPGMRVPHGADCLQSDIRTFALLPA
jgi:hypothetical protein